MICQNCGSSIRENAKFCVKCGAKVQGNQESPVADNVVTPADSCKVLSAERVNKKEYFATLCSPRARKLMKASWIVWTVNVLSTIYSAVPYFGAFVSIGVGWAIGWAIGSILLPAIIGGFACRKKSVALSVVFLIVTLLSVLPGRAINLIAAICILIFNVVVNKEYKKYIKLANAK